MQAEATADTARPGQSGLTRVGPLVSGSATYLAANIINAAIPFALLPILTRYLSPSEYGQVAMFQTLVGALGAFVGLSVVGAAGRKYYDNVDQNKLRDYLGACLQILMASTGLVLIFTFVLRDRIAQWLGIETSWVLWAVFVAFALVVINLRLGQWQVRQESGKYGAVQVSQTLCNVLLSLLLVVILLQGPGGRVAAQVCTSAIFMLVALLLLGRDNLLKLRGYNARDWADALKFGIPLIPHVGGMFLLTSVDRLVINAQLGLAEAGAYSVAATFAGVLGVVMDAGNKAFVPWLYERLRRNQLREKLQIVKATYVVFASLLMCAALAFVVGPWVVTRIAGNAYAQAGEVIGWLVLGQAFSGMYLTVTNYVFYSKRTGLLSSATIVSGLTSVFLLVIFVRLFGLGGAAIAYALAMAIRFLLTWRVAQLGLPMPWFNLNHDSSHAP